MIKTLLFWCFVALDGAALGLVFILGLAAAKPSHTSPLAVVGFFLLPALALAGLIALFVRAPWPVARIVATVMAGLPVAVVVGAALVSRGVAWKMGVPMDEGSRPDGLVQRSLESAIAANDADDVARIAAGRKARINEAAALVASLRQLEKTPGQLDVLRALLRAGVRPNIGGGGEPPLAVAIRASRFAGVEPVVLLLRAGADPNFSGGSQPSFFAALSAKTDPAVLRALLDHGADLRAVDMAGSNALYWATHHRNWPAAVLLIERGAAWQTVQMADGQGFRQFVQTQARQAPGDGSLARLKRLTEPPAPAR